MSRRRRHRTNADRIDTMLRVGAFVLGFGLLSALWLADLVAGRS